MSWKVPYPDLRQEGRGRKASFRGPYPPAPTFALWKVVGWALGWVVLATVAGVAWALAHLAWKKASSK